MKSFKEFLMEADGQDNDVQNLKILNDLKDFFNNFNATEKDKDINQEIIAKYLICKSIIKKDRDGEDTFGLKIEDSNKYLQELKEECRKLLTINSEASANSDLAKKIKSINEYILEKYKKQKLGSLLLNKGDIKIDQDMSFADFISKAEEKINEKLNATKQDEQKNKSPTGDGPIPPNVPDPHNDTKEDGGNGDNLPPTKDDNDHNSGNSGNGGNSENYGTTRQGSYLGRFTSAQMEDIMSGNEDKIANALGVMAKAAKDRCDELLRQVKEKVEKNSKYLEEEEIAQKVLWENIFNRLPKQTKLKVQKQHGTESIYKDKDNQKLTEIINKYKAQIDNLVKTTVDNCQPLGEKLHAFSTSAKMEDKLKEQLRMNVRNFTNKLYDITLEVEKASRKSGFFENRDIKKGAKKEEEWNKFKNSDKGENFNRRLSEKAEAIKKELLKILPNIQKASNEAEINIKLVSTLIKDSTNANDFFVKASNSKKIIENGRKISIFDWLQKRGIPLPINKEINDKYSKDLTVASWNELFKDEKFLNSLNGYGEKWDNFKTGLDNLKKSRNLEDFKKFREQFGKDFETEVNYYCNEFVELEKQQQKGNGNNGITGKTDVIDKTGNDGGAGKTDATDDNYYDNLYYGDKNKEDEDEDDDTKKKLEKISRIDWSNWNTSVTTNSCDGLPIGARKYSKAVRRRMNHALNKYL